MAQSRSMLFGSAVCVTSVRGVISICRAARGYQVRLDLKTGDDRETFDGFKREVLGDDSPVCLEPLLTL
jgi:hypothetical protein